MSNKETWTVSWTMLEDKMIKFKEPDKVFDLSDAVAKFMESNKLGDKSDYKAEVTVEENESDDKDESSTAGTVVKLVTKDVETKEDVKEEPEKESKDVESDKKDVKGVTKERTVAGVSLQYKGVTFKEEEKVWYTLSDKMDVQKFKDEMTGKKAEFTIEVTDKGNDIILDYVEEETEQEDVKEEKQSSYNNSTQNSIECQACVNSANRVVSAMVENNDVKMDDVKARIKEIAEHNHSVLMNLKKRG